MSKVNLTIDGQMVSVDEGTTILDAARKVHVIIPTLCHHPDQTVKANCRICLVETAPDKLVTACSTQVREGMTVKTNTRFVREIQKGVLELILANHDQDCLKCVRNGNCELQDLCEKFSISREDIDIISPRDTAVDAIEMDLSNPAIIRDYSKCIKCNRCIEVCREVQDASILAGAHRSVDYTVQPAFGKKLSETLCTYCGQCITVCPVGAIYEKSEIDAVYEALDDPELHVVVQIAPAVRVSIGEEFGYDPGTQVTGKVVSALKRLGFNRVFDTNFTADLTIVEEGNEVISRIISNDRLPVITSCSPGWINYMEGFFPEVIDHVSTCKSPQQMFGALSKTYYADKIGVDPSKMFTVSVMPCTAKKYEARREEMMTDGRPDVDAVLTTRELARIIKSAGLDFENLPEEMFDDPFGITTGAAAIFGVTGGVAEAALRTVYEVITKEPLENIEFHAIRGFDGIRKATIEIGGMPINIAIAHGLGNARILIEEVKEGRSPYDFIEIMACTGGCIGGGGQPISKDPDIRRMRIEGIYNVDQGMEIRQSHKNKGVLELYEEFLGEPNSDRAHHLLHTHFRPRA